MMKILIIDDDQDDQGFFVEAMQEIGDINVMSLSDCMNVTPFLDSHHTFDAVFLDFNIPGINGKTCLSEIKAHPRYKNVPVFMLSGSVSEKDFSDFFEAGAQRFIVKPTTHAGLVNSLKGALQHLDEKPAKDNFVIAL